MPFSEAISLQYSVMILKGIIIGIETIWFYHSNSYNTVREVRQQLQHSTFHQMPVLDAPCLLLVMPVSLNYYTESSVQLQNCRVDIAKLEMFTPNYQGATHLGIN